MPIGDPALPGDLAKIYADCGVDIFEVGIPSDNPWMDGPSVAGSMQRTLAAGIDQVFIGKTLLDFSKRFEQQAIVVMSYNNINLEELTRGHSPVFDGLLCVGIDAAELIESVLSIDSDDVLPISFMPYEMFKEDIERVRVSRSAYLMLQASPGKTGIRSEINTDLNKKIETLRNEGITIPILPGFGISSPEQAATAIQAGADGVIIGSACLQHAMQGAAAIREFLTEVRRAIDGC